jgi:hypothetical protein
MEKQELVLALGSLDRLGIQDLPFDQALLAASNEGTLAG